MLKILYAAGNHSSSKIQLSRFLKAIEGHPYIIKIAAYKQSSPNCNVDWTLDCLLNIYNPLFISPENNDNFKTYYHQVKCFNPDLIISDIEYFSSHIANVLNITLWQVSSLLINFAIPNKYDFGLFKKYAYQLNRSPVYTQRISNIIDNSNINLIYSHLGDIANPPKLKDNFEWIKPYHNVGKDYIPCKHNIVSASLDGDKKIFNLLKKYSDSIAFTERSVEQFDNPKVKSLENEQEYYCNLKNCNLFVCQGQASFLADAFYNGKYSVTLLNLNDNECIVNGLYSEHYGCGSTVFNDDLSSFMGKEVAQNDNKIQFLHEKINEIIN